MTSNQYSIGPQLKEHLRIPLRTQFDIIKLLLETIRDHLVLINNQSMFKNQNTWNFGKYWIVENTKGMSRIFYEVNYPDYEERRMYTVQTFGFPFRQASDECNNQIFIYNSSDLQVVIDSAIISQMSELLNQLRDGSDKVIDMWGEQLLNILTYDYGEEDSKIIQVNLYGKPEKLYIEYPTYESLIILMSKLLLFDFGYLRFDCDPKHCAENHPLYHMDIFLNKSVTYKIGLNNEITIEDFINILDNTKSVSYLNMAKY